MNEIGRAFGLALKGIFHPWIWWLSLRPFLIGALFWFVILWFSWTPLLDTVQHVITNSSLSDQITRILSASSWNSFRAVITPYFSVVILMPFIIMSLLIVVSFTTVSAVIRHIEKQRPYLELTKHNGGNIFGSIWTTLWCSFIFMLLVLITLPIWWVPPVFAIIPPVLWGWLTTRLMSYDVLARHASKEERQALLRERRLPLLCMGVLAGLLGAAPTFFWLSSVFVLLLFPLISMVMMWVYSIVFIFAALWFSHYLLFALKNIRLQKGEMF